MGQLGIIAKELEQAAPAFFANIRQIIKRRNAEADAEAQSEEQPTEEPVVAENVTKKAELIKEDYQLKNIKRLINKK